MSAAPFYMKQLFGTDRFVILHPGKVPGHLTRLDDKGSFRREDAALFTASPDMLAALKGLIASPFPGRDAYCETDPVYAEIVAHNEALAACRAAIAKAEGRS